MADDEQREPADVSAEAATAAPEPAAPGEQAAPGQGASDAAGPARPASGRTPAKPTGWAALASALHPRATRAQVLAGVLCAVLGFAVVVQMRQASDPSLSDLRTDELVRLLDETSTRADQLSSQAADLQAEKAQLESGSSSRQAALDAARRNAAMQGILSGRLPAVGSGVRISLQDPSRSIRPVTMLNMLEELRNAGAEAIQVGDQRVTASSAFTGAPGAIQLDGVTLTAPYVWLVIGDPDTIQTALQIPGGALAYVRNDGGTGDVAKVQHVVISALRDVPQPKYATLAPVPTS